MFIYFNAFIASININLSACDLSSGNVGNTLNRRSSVRVLEDNVEAVKPMKINYLYMLEMVER